MTLSRHRGARPLGALVAVLLALLALVVAPAQAKELSISNLSATINETTLVNGQTVTAQMDFCLPDDAAVGDTFTITLPEQFTDWTPSFTIKDPDNAVVGTGTTDNTTSPSTAEVVLTSAFAATQGSSNVCVSLSLSGTFTTDLQAGETTTLVYDVGGSTTSEVITIAPVGRPLSPEKWGWFNDANECRTNLTGCLVFDIALPADGDEVTISDTAHTGSPSWTWYCAGDTSLDIYTYSGSGTTTTRTLVRSISLTDGANDIVTAFSCTSDSLSATIDTSGLSSDQTIELVAYATPAEANNGGNGGETYTNDATVTVDGEAEDVTVSLYSSYIGGLLSGDHIALLKGDTAGNAADTADAAVDLTSSGGSTALALTIQNTGSTTLSNIVLSDVVVTGSGTVSDLSCDFSPYGGPSTGVSGGDAQLPPGNIIHCTATLSGVSGSHQDTATVTATGNGTVRASNDYWATYGQINLTLAKVLTTSGTVSPGGTVTFTLTPHNDGPSGAVAGWSVTDILPTGLTISSMSGDGYTCTTATATCVAADGLAAGADGKVITVVAVVDQAATGTLHNVAYVSPSSDESLTETNPLVVPTTDTDTSTSSTDNDAQADVVLTTATPTPSASASATVSPSATATPTTAATPGTTLARTGADVLTAALVMVGALGAGAVALRRGRKA